MASELQNILMFQKWKLTVDMTKIVIFRKGDRLPNELRFKYNGSINRIESNSSHLRVVFTSWGIIYICKEVSGSRIKS